MSQPSIVPSFTRSQTHDVYDPVEALPLDLIFIIFELVVKSGIIRGTSPRRIARNCRLLQAFRLSHVSREWRSTTHSMPLLWNTVTLRLTDWVDVETMHPELVVPQARHSVEAILRRSNPVGLRVELQLQGGGAFNVLKLAAGGWPSAIQAITRTFAPHVHRLSCLVIKSDTSEDDAENGCEAMAKVITLWGHEAVRLRVLIFHWGGAITWTHVSTNLQCPPNLDVLCFQDIVLKPECIATNSGLRQLELTASYTQRDGSAQPVSVALISLLSASPQLETLVLNTLVMEQGRGGAVGSPKTRCQLPRLKEIYFLQCSDTVDVGRLLLSLEVPLLEKLVCHLDQGPDTGDFKPPHLPKLNTFVLKTFYPETKGLVAAILRGCHSLSSISLFFVNITPAVDTILESLNYCPQLSRILVSSAADGADISACEKSLKEATSGRVQLRVSGRVDIK